MANRFWVGGGSTTLWNQTGSTNWAATSGGAAGALIPTAADDVIFDANSGTGNVTFGGGVCRSFDATASSAIVFSIPTGSPNLNIGDASGGNCKFGGSMTFSGTALTIGLVSTSNNGGAGWQFTCGGKTLPTIAFSGIGGKWVFQDAVTSATSIAHSNGTLDTNSKAVQTASFAPSSSTTRVLTLGSTVWTLTGTAGNVFTNTTGTNQTITSNTATFIFNGISTSGVCILGAQNWNGASFTFSGGGNWAVRGAATIGTFTFTGNAVKSASVSFDSSITCAAFVASGQSVATGNRLFVSSATVGSSITITAASVTISAVDFKDVTGAGAGTWSGTSIGTCLGNSGITFTVGAGTSNGGSGVNRYWVGNLGNMSDTTHWSTTSGGSSGASIPLPQDDIYFDANSFTTTGQRAQLDMPRVGRNINTTGCNQATTTMGSSSGLLNELYGSLTYAGTCTCDGNASGGWSFAGRGSHTITSNGTINAGAPIISAPGGTYTLSDAWSTGGNNRALTCNFGTFDANGFSCTNAIVVVSTTMTKVWMRSSTWTITRGAAGSSWQMLAAPSVLDCGTSTIVFSGPTGTQTFAGGGATYGTLQYTVTNSVQAIVLTGANTFNTLFFGSGRGITLPSSTTTTVTNLNCSGAVFGYQYFPGTQGAVGTTAVSSPNAAVLQITGAITVETGINLPSYSATGGTQAIVSKINSALTTGYAMRIGTTGLITLFIDNKQAISTASLSTVFSAGADAYFRAIFNGTTLVTFQTSPNGSTSWTNLGTAVALVNAGISTSTDPLLIGQRTTGNDSFTGKIYYVKVYSDATPSTVAFNADFRTKAFGANTFTESSVNAATVTIDGDTDRAGDGRIILQSSTPGTPATLAKGGPWFDNEYLTVKDVTGTGVDNFMGLSSVNVSGNSTVTFGRLAQKQSMLAML